jgi:hypothetical protein
MSMEIANRNIEDIVSNETQGKRKKRCMLLEVSRPRTLVTTRLTEGKTTIRYSSCSATESKKLWWAIIQILNIED